MDYMIRLLFPLRAPRGALCDIAKSLCLYFQSQIPVVPDDYIDKVLYSKRL